MKANSLKKTNPYLKADDERVRSMRIRSIASSTAIETGEPIAEIENMLKARKLSHHRATLA
jgi:hypothetical protein